MKTEVTVNEALKISVGASESGKVFIWIERRKWAKDVGLANATDPGNPSTDSAANAEKWESGAAEVLWQVTDVLELKRHAARAIASAIMASAAEASESTG